MHPTFRNLTDSYEAWAYRNGLLKQLPRLERQGLIESAEGASEDRLYRLTADGLLHALGGRDPEACWARPWDGRWRLVLFDVPGCKSRQREKLRDYLRWRGFGCLQKSVWVSPGPLTEQCQLLRGAAINVESLVLLEARPCAGESDAEIVAGAWDFARINDRYERDLNLLERRPSGHARTAASALTLRRWGGEERAAWTEAVRNDPLLRASILPSGYLGQRTWRRRQSVLHEARRQLQAFALSRLRTS